MADHPVFDYAKPTTESFLPALWRRMIAWGLLWIAVGLVIGGVARFLYIARTSP